MSALKSLAWEGESLRLLDQTKLPSEITYLKFVTMEMLA